MKKKITLEALGPVFSGGIRIADNFLESEPFLRGSVLRAAFANEILLECPLADVPGRGGQLNYIEVKDPEGKCLNCPKRMICERFSDMTFSFAYPDDGIPAPFTSVACKDHGTDHPIKDTIVESGVVKCEKCAAGLGRMESLKGLIKRDESGYRKVSPKSSLSTHTAIDYNTHTAEDGKLYTVKSISKGTVFSAVIDDCETNMVEIGTVIRAGRYSSAGYGKLIVRSLESCEKDVAEEVEENVNTFESRFGISGKATLLFTADAILDLESDSTPKTNEEYRKLWNKALIGEDSSLLSVEKVTAETQLYTGYNTSRPWGEWKDKTPTLMVKKGTSILLNYDVGRRNEALSVLTKMQLEGIGEQTKDGYGAVCVCHPFHILGV